MQKPDELDRIAGHKTNFHLNYGYLMQFKDGNRIDLHISTLDFVLKEFKKDKLTITLLDKDNILPKIPAPTDRDYWVTKPTQNLLYRSSNQFWWCLKHVQKLPKNSNEIY